MEAPRVKRRGERRDKPRFPAPALSAQVPRVCSHPPAKAPAGPLASERESYAYPAIRATRKPTAGESRASRRVVLMCPAWWSKNDLRDGSPIPPIFQGGDVHEALSTCGRPFAGGALGWRVAVV